MFLALKMTELWQFEIKSVTGRTYGTLVTFKSNSKSDKVDLAKKMKDEEPESKQMSIVLVLDDRSTLRYLWRKPTIVIFLIAIK